MLGSPEADRRGARHRLLEDGADLLLTATRSSSCQLAVWTGEDALLSVTAGRNHDGSACEDRDLNPGYCMSKLVVAAAVLECERTEGLDLEQPVRELVDLPYVNRDATVLDVMEHRAGLVEPSVVTWRMTPEISRPGLLPLAPPTMRAGYSDLLASIVLCALVERCSGTSALAFIEERVLGPSEAGDLLLWGSSSAAVFPGVAGLPDRTIPLLSELLPDQRESVEPSTGVFASARGVALLLRWLLFTGPGSADLRSRLRDRLDGDLRTTFDPVLGRSATFAFGMMADLPAHGVLTSGPRTVGHTAAITNWLAVADLASEEVRVGYTNGIAPSDAAVVANRHALDRAMQGDLEAIGQGDRERDRTPGRAERSRQGPDRRLESSTPLADRLRRVCLAADPAVEVRFVLAFARPNASSIVRCEFAGGGLAAVDQVKDAHEVDAVIVSEEADVLRWLDDPAARLGALLLDGTISVTGDLWVLSPLEHWAWATAIALSTS